MQIVLLHGIPGSARDWDLLREQIDGDWEVVAPDLVGFGDRASARGDLWADAQAEALAAALPFADETLLVGHDFGGPVALHLLPRLGERVRGIVLAATNAFPDTPIPFPLSLVRLPLAPRLLFSPLSLRMMLRGHPDPKSAIGPPAQQTAIREIFTTALRELGPRFGDVQRRLEAVDVPVRVIWGERDPFFGLEQGRRTAQLVGAPLEVVPGGGHFLPHEAPDAFIRALESLARPLVRT